MSDRAKSTTAAVSRETSTGEGRVASDSRGSNQGVVQISYGPAVSTSRALQVKLKSAYLMAVESLRQVTACGELFAPLEADGVDMMVRTVYERATGGMEATWCRHAVAGTSIGGRTVFLCRRFAVIPVEEAASIVIHEALHKAGMSEAPLDASSMTGEEISTMVRRTCGLFEMAKDIRVARNEPETAERNAPGGARQERPTAVKVDANSSALAPTTESLFQKLLDVHSSAPR